MSPNMRIVLLGVFAALLVALAGWIITRVRTTPAERERRRRLLVNRVGRLADGMLTDVSGDTLYYSYNIMGVEYAAAQEVADLGGSLPGDRHLLIGPVTLKYLPRNPANSILLCEEWSGLRVRPQTNQILTTEGAAHQHP